MIRAAFRVPGFGRLYVGLAASMFGDSLMLIVLSMWVKTLTGSNAAAGLTFLAMTAPALLAPLFGYVVDRVPRRTFLVAAELASAAMVLPLLLVRDAGELWLVYLVAALYGVSFVVVPAALNGLFKEMLPEDVLVEANASLSVTREAFRLVGPLLGATVFALAGGGTVAVLDAATFVVAAVAVWSMRSGRQAEAAPDTGEPWLRQVGAGLAFLRRTPVLLHVTVSLSLALLVLGFTESAVYAVLDAFHRPATFVGPVLTTQGVGAICGGLLASRLVRRWSEAPTVMIGLLLLGLGGAGVAVSIDLWQLFVSVAVIGAGIPVMTVAFSTLLQRGTPGHLMGRVSTTVDVLTTTPQAVSIAAGALLVTLLDYRLIFTLIAAGMLAAAAYLPLALRDRFALPASEEGPEPPVAQELIPGSVLPEPLAASAPPLPEVGTLSRPDPPAAAR